METRNQDSHPIRYGKTNLPLSQEEASKKIDFLTERIPAVRDQLELTNVNEFGSQEEYASWRRRAIAALSMMKAELRFLEGWLGLSKKASPAPAAAVLQTNEQVEGVKLYAMMLADEISNDYILTYDRSCLPENKTNAQLRMSELGALKARLQAAFTDVAARLAETNASTQKALVIVKAPLHQLLLQVETEVSVVRGFIRAMGGIENDWMTLLAQALARAVSEGFTLTQKEEETLAIIRSRENF
jgi:hypothetical protein